VNEIYLLYSCDAWKSKSSMRLIMATTIRETIEGAVCASIQKGDMDYAGKSGSAASAAYARERNDRLLEFGYLETLRDGEWL
jgi:hypothetical protein